MNGYLYGFNDSILTGLSFDTGEDGRDRSVGKGSLTYADGHLYILGEENVVGLAEAAPDGYNEKGPLTFPTVAARWAHPVVSGGRLYIRNQECSRLMISGRSELND